MIERAIQRGKASVIENLARFKTVVQTVLICLHVLQAKIKFARRIVQIKALLKLHLYYFTYIVLRQPRLLCLFYAAVISASHHCTKTPTKCFKGGVSLTLRV